jgi:hypothetical protein
VLTPTGVFSRMTHWRLKQCPIIVRL